MKSDEDKPDLADIMKGNQEQDALDAKTGQAAPHIKEGHLQAKELVSRLSCARMATSTTDAIQHDLDRGIALCAEIRRNLKQAEAKLLR